MPRRLQRSARGTVPFRYAAAVAVPGSDSRKSLWLRRHRWLRPRSPPVQLVGNRDFKVTLSGSYDGISSFQGAVGTGRPGRTGESLVLTISADGLSATGEPGTACKVSVTH